MPKNATQFYLGCDPGKEGGLAIVSSNRELMWYERMGESPADIWRLFEYYTSGKYTNRIEYAVLEFVSYFPGMGGVSAFTFGGNYYALQMALTAAKIPYSIVRPMKWQKEFNVPARGGSTAKARSEHKERLRKIAQRLYPAPNSGIWDEALKIQRACCDAILLSEYARRVSK